MDRSQPTTISETRVLFASAEADPFVRVGGLGDVGGALPQTLRSLSAAEAGGARIDIRLVIPFHGAINPTAYDLRPVTAFPIPYQDGAIQAEVFTTQINGMPVYLISGDPFLKDAPVYSLDARLDGPKFTFFSLAMLELARRLDWAPHILHANDWHTALAVYQLGLLRPTDTFFANTSSILTLHNLPYMGAGAEGSLADFHLPPSTDPRLPVWARQIPLPLGLLAADRIVAVSPTYAREILTPEFGNGLQDFLATRGPDLTGILNGIDTGLWNPAADANITHFSLEDLASRALNKRDLQSRFSLEEDPSIPLLISIGRMDQQKGVDLIIAALSLASEQTWQAIILGTGNPALEAAARQLEIDFPDRVRAVVRFDNRLAHQMYASGDILLMPSRYEPCGLAQMIAMRYGCVPVACATGGLADSIIDYSADSDNSTGFLFQTPTVDRLSLALTRALNLFPNRPAWEALQKRDMQQDFQWKCSALAYSSLYRELRG